MAVAALLPILEGPLAEMELAVAVDTVHGREAAFLQPRRRHDDLEDGARGVLALQGAIHEGRQGIPHELEPLLAVEVAREAVEREGRARGQGEDVATSRVENDHGAGLARHRALGRLLDAPIHRGDDLGAGIRLLPPHDLHLPAQGVDLDTLAAVATAEVFVEKALQPRLADHVSAPVPPLLHLLVADLAHVPEEVRGEGARGVDALGLDLDDHARQIELELLDAGHLLESEAPPHPDGPDGVGGDSLEPLFQLPQGDLEKHGEPGQDRPAVLHLPRDERERESGAIVHEGETIAVEENAARRRHGPDTDPVLVGELLELAALEDLEIPELAEEADEGDGDHGGEGQDTPPPGFPLGRGLLVQIHGFRSMAATGAACGPPRRRGGRPRP